MCGGRAGDDILLQFALFSVIDVTTALRKVCSFGCSLAFVFYP